MATTFCQLKRPPRAVHVRFGRLVLRSMWQLGKCRFPEVVLLLLRVLQRLLGMPDKADPGNIFQHLLHVVFAEVLYPATNANFQGGSGSWS